MRLLSAQLRERRRAVVALDQHVSTLEALLLDRSGADVAALQARVAHERAALDLAAPRTLIEYADGNVELVKRLSDSVHDVGTLRTQKLIWDTVQRDTSQALKNTEERVRIGGTSEAVGLILLAEKRKLKPLPVLKHELGELQTDYAQTRISLIEVREQQNALSDIGAATSAALAHADLSEEAAGKLRETFYRVLGTRAQVLVQLGALQSKLAAAQGEAEQELQGVIEATTKLNALLDARLLWTPSHAPVDSDWLGGFGADSAGVWSGSRWKQALLGAWAALVAAPLRSMLALAILAVLLLLRQRSDEVAAQYQYRKR